MTKKFGKGIQDLLANLEDARVPDVRPVSVMDGEHIYEISVGEISPNPKQPRKHFDEAALAELAQSIKTHGIIQPLVLRRVGDRYEIIAGERRYRAAKIVGLATVPCVVKKITDQKARELALIENLQRENLNAIEEAEALKELMDMYKMTQEEVAERVSKSRPNVANTMRLLGLQETVKGYVREEKLSAGHARALLAVKSPIEQLRLADRVLAANLSVRDTEKLVREYLNPTVRPAGAPKEKGEMMSREFKGLLTDMQRAFGTRVHAVGNERKGRIYLDYFSEDDLNRFYEVVQSLLK